MISIIFCTLLSFSVIEAGVIRSEDSEMALPSSNETLLLNPFIALPANNDTSVNLIFPLPSSNESLLVNSNRTLYDEQQQTTSNSTRQPKTGWYHHFWREKLIAPSVEVGSSSSESADSWSMECDCSTTPRMTRSTSARSTAASATTASERATASTSRATGAAQTGNATAAAFDDGSDYDRSWEDSNTFEIGDLAWRKRYRIWLKRCGCDRLYDY